MRSILVPLLLMACKGPPEGPLGIGTGSWGLTCLLDATGRPSCWGIADCDLPLPEACQRAPALCPGAAEVLPPRRAGLRDLRVGSTHACALDEEGAAVCWGDPRDGQLDAPDEIFSRVSPGAWHTCGITEAGALLCWGDDSAGQASPPERGPWRDVSAGGSHSCGVLEDTTLDCWGLGPTGQLDAPETSGWKTVHTADKWACAVDEGDRPQCWGEVPTAVVPPEGPVKQLGVGSAHLCWRLFDDTVACSGEGTRAAPPAGLVARHLDAGIAHSCVVDDSGAVVCWAAEEVGEVCIPD